MTEDTVLICLPEGTLLKMLHDIEVGAECDSLLADYALFRETSLAVIANCDTLTELYKDQNGILLKKNSLMKQENEINEYIIKAVKKENTILKVSGAALLLSLIASFIW